MCSFSRWSIDAKLYSLYLVNTFSSKKSQRQIKFVSEINSIGEGVGKKEKSIMLQILFNSMKNFLFMKVQIDTTLWMESLEVSEMKMLCLLWTCSFSGRNLF